MGNTISYKSINHVKRLGMFLDCKYKHRKHNDSGSQGVVKELSINDSVKDDELLIRCNFNPESIDANGNVRVNAVALSDLKVKGYSLCRDKMVIYSVFVEKINSLKHRKPKDRTKTFISKINAKSIRDEKYNSDPAFVINASPSRNDNSHADIKAFDANKSEAELREIRSLLLPYIRANMLEAATYIKDKWPNENFDQEEI